MFFRLLLLFSLFPIIELAILIKVGSVIGLFNTIALVVLTAVTGAYLAKRQGIATFTRIHQQLSVGVLPTESMVDGLCIIIAAVVLITPGLLTDTFGFLLLIPATRSKVKQLLIGFFKKNISKRINM